MTRRLVAMVALVTTLGACSSTPDRAATVTTSANSTSSSATTSGDSSSSSSLRTTTSAPADLKLALLTLNDMPAGWTINTSGDSSSDDSFCPGHDALSGKPPGETGEAEADFEAAEFGPFVTETLDRFDHGKAEDEMNKVEAAINDCTTWSTTDTDGTVTSWKLLPLSFPKHADQTFALKLEADSSSLALDADVVFVRSGDVIIGVITASVGSVDPALITTMTDKALEKLGVS